MPPPRDPEAFAREACQDLTLLVGRTQLLRRRVAVDAPDRARCVAALDEMDGRLKHLATLVAGLSGSNTTTRREPRSVP